MKIEIWSDVMCLFCYIAEWTFHYTWRGEEKRFDGFTIAKLQDGKIAYLREYATTAVLYDWQGEWQAT